MAPKKLWRRKEWVPHEWATMHEAWSRIFASLSNNMPLTRRDLKAELLAGRLVGAARVFNKKKGIEQFIVFEREFWKPVEFPYAWNVTGWGEHYREGEEWDFFVRRRELDKRHPAAANATPSERPRDSMAPPQRRRGPVTTHDWHSIDGEIARRCIDPKTGRVRVPKKGSSIVGDMLKWCEDQGWAKPARSEMSEAVRRVCAALKPAET
jgi:hypothetical protein